MSGKIASLEREQQPWPILALGDVANIVNGGTPKSKTKDYWGGSVQWLTPKEMGASTQRSVSATDRTITAEGLAKSSARLIPPNSVILSTRAPIGHLAINDVEMAFNQGCRGIVPSAELDVIFLYYFLLANKQQLNDLGTGTTFKELSGTNLKSVALPIPPLNEQKRIVAVLDQAFAALDRARARVEKNRLIAPDIFDNVLASVDGEQRALGSLVKIRTGKLDANAAVEKGQYPFFTCAKEVYAINRFAFDCEAILLAGNNAVGDFNVKHYQGKFNAYQRTYVITVNDTGRLLYRYLYYQLLRALQHFKESSVGAGTKFLKLGIINELLISAPTIALQQEVVMKLDLLFEKTQHLETLYSRKIADLDDLKQSLLRKAFSGQLV